MPVKLLLIIMSTFMLLTSVFAVKTVNPRFDASFAEYNDKSVLKVKGEKKYAGKQITIIQNKAILATGTLKDSKEGSFLELTFPADIKFNPDSFKVKVEGYGDIPVKLALRLLNKKTTTETGQNTDNSPKILAIANFGNFTDKKESEVASLGTRDQLVAELVSNYSCYTVGRSNGYNLALEESLGNIKGINNDKQLPAGIPAVDYAISGYFQRIGRSNKIECILQILNPAVDELPERISVKVPSVFEAPEFLAEFLAKKLKLKNSRLSLKKEGEKSDKTWAVLPFSRIDKIMDFGKITEEELSLKSELTLQDQSGIEKIVDRKTINAVLNEMKIATMQSSTEKMAGKIASIVGANRILMGSVVPYQDGLLRLDITLVDGVTALVLNTRSAICSKAYLDEAVEILTKDISRYAYSVPEVKIASPEERSREGEFYLTSADTNGHDWRDIRSTFCMNRGMLLESAYYLLKDTEHLHKIASILTNIYNDMRSPGEYGRNLLFLADKIYSQIYTTNAQPSLILDRAYCNYLLGNFQLALNLAKEHLEKYPKTATNRVNYRMMMCYYKMGQYKKSAEYLSKCRGNKIYWISKIYKHINDDRAELREFKSVKRFDWFTRENVRFIELTRELEGGEAALQVLKRTSMIECTWRPDIRYEIAYAFALTGKKDVAARIFSSLLNTPSSVLKSGISRDYIFYKTSREFKKKIRKTMEKLGLKKREEKWKPPYKVRRIPEQYKFLLVPLGEVSKNKIEEMKNRFKEVFDTELLVSKKSIPISALPKNAFDLSERMYNARKICKWVCENVKLPDDAFQVVLFSREPFANTTSSYFNERSGINIFSYYRTQDKVTGFIGGLFGEIFSDPYKCYIYHCTGFFNEWGRCGKEICEDCQKRFKDFDFEKRMQRVKAYRKRKLKNPKIVIKI